MPIVSQATQFSTASGRGMNAWSLQQLVARRVTGYSMPEYLSEINAAYKEVWEEIMQLDELFFSDIVTVTITTQGDQFDLKDNLYNNLNGSIPRLHQIHRVRIQQPSSGSTSDNQMFAASPRNLNDPDYLARQQMAGQTAITTPPYLYVPFGEGGLKFAQPLAVGVNIEVWFTYSLIDLQILTVGQISNTGTAVTGNGTFFTQICPPDLQAALPGATAAESQVDVEVITGGMVYRVVTIASDTALTTQSIITPTQSNGSYILASVPEFSPAEHRVIADIATRNMFSTPANDARFAQWAGIAATNVQRMKNTLIQRQRQENPKKGRFPYGVVRRSRFFGAK